MRKTIDGYLIEGDDSSWIHPDGDGIDSGTLLIRQGDGGGGGVTSTDFV